MVAESPVRDSANPNRSLTTRPPKVVQKIGGSRLRSIRISGAKVCFGAPGVHRSAGDPPGALFFVETYEINLRRFVQHRDTVHKIRIVTNRKNPIAGFRLL